MISICDHSIEESTITDESVIIDAGASVGDFAIGIRKNINLKCPIYCIELSPNNITTMQKKLEEYDNITILNKALVGKMYGKTVTCFEHYKMHFASPPTEIVMDEGISSYLVATAIFIPIPAWSNIYNLHKTGHYTSKCKVETITYDKLLSLYNLKKIDYLKMDIEGAEINILDDMSVEQLENIQQIALEYHPDVKGGERLKVHLKKLKDSGFTIINPYKHEYYCFREDATGTISKMLNTSKGPFEVL